MPVSLYETEKAKGVSELEDLSAAEARQIMNNLPESAQEILDEKPEAVNDYELIRDHFHVIADSHEAAEEDDTEMKGTQF